MSVRKILVMGLPGAGKTTLATALVARLGAVHFNADEVRANINRDLGFTPAGRVEQARRMGWLCDQVVKAGGIAVADFVCPTEECRAAFGADLVVYVDRIEASRFADTNRMFVPPSLSEAAVPKLVSIEASMTLDQEVDLVSAHLFDPQAPTALFVGRWQPFHDGHRALVVEGINRIGQACIAVRSMPTGPKNPFPFSAVRERIEERLAEFDGRFTVIRAPNVGAILYGRDVGYVVERIDLSPELQAISGTETRKRMMVSGEV